MSTFQRRFGRWAVARRRSRKLAALAILVYLLTGTGSLEVRAAEVISTGDHDLEVVQCPAEFNLGTDYLDSAEWSTEELDRYRCRWYESIRIRHVETDIDDRRLRVRVTMEQMGDRDVEVKLHVSLVSGDEVLVTKNEVVEIDEGERNREAIRLRMGRDELLEIRPELTVGIDRIEGD